MRTLSFPVPSNANHALLRFPEVGNMRRQTDFNRNAFLEWTADQPFNVENEHILVGLLHQLSINKDWDLKYVVDYTRLRAYSLCTQFKITSPNRVGQAISDGFYRNNTREHWCLIDNTKVYDEATLDLDKLRPVVPLCSTITSHGYKHNVTKPVNYIRSAIGDLAVMGVDLVELAVGWWAYQKLNRERDAGPGAYIAQYPFVYAQLMHNQLSIINVLYEHVINGTPSEELIKTDRVVFTLANDERFYGELIEHLVKFYSNRRLVSFDHFMKAIISIYTEPYFNYVRAGNNAVFAQTMWIWEPAILKLLAIYLTFCNKGGYKAGDFNTMIARTHPYRIQNLGRIPEAYFKGWFYELAMLVHKLNEENLG